jgi:TonB family protein
MRIEYNHILRQYQGVRGKMIVKFIIDESGKVIYLKVIESTLNNCRMENEQINIIKECLFDNDNKPNLTTVVYPFVFSQ